MGFGAFDLKSELEPQNARKRERTLPDPVTGQAQFKAGYATLDQASPDAGKKERRGLSPDANFCRRY